MSAHAAYRSRILSRRYSQQPREVAEVGWRAQMEFDPVSPRRIMTDGRIVAIVAPGL
jgi:hypothetical protein